MLTDDRWRLGAYAEGWYAGGGATIDVTEPATGAVSGSFASASADAVATAAATADRAQPAWAEAGPATRAGLLDAAARVLTDHRDEVTSTLVRESGSTVAKATGEIDGTLAELRAAAALAMQPQGRLLPADRPGQISLAQRVPVGVVGTITPWNVPLLLAARTVAPALALGNTVVLKPDPHTPVSGGVVLAEVFRRAGFPDGVFTLVLGAAGTGEALVTDPRVGLVSFTGSTATGRRIGELAGRHLTKVTLELGGNSPFIVLDDADLDRAATAGAFSSFHHQGQICMAASRHLVHERVAEEYVALLCERARKLRIGDPAADPTVDLGPLIDDRQLFRVAGIVSATVEAGATVRAGGDPDGRFYPATVLCGVTPGMAAFTEEIFGPVAPVTVFADDEEALRLAAMTDHGLAAAVHSRTEHRAMRIAARIPAGMVHINDQTVNDTPHAPFGGRGASGNGGRFGGEANWETFTQWQWLTFNDPATSGRTDR
ncbi:aldehyde dehydrogenase family protein [Virgisporangium aurantiacum]|uniref:Benzaldehyde dehydrogenase n=1 Tax=Virgisporangium aurantiacum TaxID=175570 RepID=A0A8J3Z8P4_9ACTN|nr:aldehyde dehydrogenase family protein [Virgisporangium aurantiacum]GIJ56933.1 benzaldehyde dehydrogenase [Virgisporangium aurantiacum]